MDHCAREAVRHSLIMQMGTVILRRPYRRRESFGMIFAAVFCIKGIDLPRFCLLNIQSIQQWDPLYLVWFYSGLLIDLIFCMLMWCVSIPRSIFRKLSCWDSFRMSRVFLSSSCTLVDPRHKYSIIKISETAVHEEKCEMYGFRQSPSSSLKDGFQPLFGGIGVTRRQHGGVISKMPYRS